MSPLIVTLIILAATVVLMVTDKLPLGLVAVMSAVSLILTKVLTPAEAFSGFVDSNVIRLVAMLVIGAAFFQTGLAYDFAHWLLKYAKSERAVLAVVMLVSGLLSSVLSNTGVTTTMIPIVYGICLSSGISRSKLMMPITIAVGVGGTCSLVGAVPNSTANGVLEEFGYEGFGFFEMAKVGLPMLFIVIAFMCTIGYKLLPDRKLEDDVDIKTQDFSSVPKWKKIVVLVVMALTFLGMIFEKQIGIKMHVTAVVGAIVLVLCGVLSEKDALKAIDLRTPFILAGTLPLATALSATGADTAISNAVVSVLGQNATPFVIMLAMFLISCVCTQFMSNTASAAMLCPIAISIAGGLGAPPKAVMMAIVFGASFAFSTPLGMPPNAMVMGPGGYKFNDYVKVGVPLLLVTFVVSMILLPLFWPITIG